jgi:hypothetical protein
MDVYRSSLCDWNVIFSLCLGTHIAPDMTVKMINNAIIFDAYSQRRLQCHMQHSYSNPKDAYIDFIEHI